MALLDTRAIKTFIKRPTSAERKTKGEHSDKCFTFAGGQKLHVSRQAREVEVDAEARGSAVNPLIAENTQEVLLGYDFSQQCLEESRFLGGKVKSAVEKNRRRTRDRRRRKERCRSRHSRSCRRMNKRD